MQGSAVLAWINSLYPFLLFLFMPLALLGQNDVRINALVYTIVYYAWDLNRCSSVSNTWMHTPIYGSPFILSSIDLWIFPIDPYAWIWSKSGLSSCSFLDKMTLFDHMQIFLGNENSPRLWLDAYHAPLIPIAPGFSWQCDFGRWRSLEPCFALCVKISYHLQYATMWFPLHS